MSLVNQDHFSIAYADNCELLTQFDRSEFIDDIRLHRKGKGELDWPIEV